MKIIATGGPRVYARVVSRAAITYPRAMTQRSRVIYLPPGVVPGPTGPSAASPVNTGIPFDRQFFEHVVPPAVSNFCKQIECQVPVLEVTTIDGTTHYVNGISGLADRWVALHTSRPDHPHPVEVFVAYQTIFRVEIHPEPDEKRHPLGFITGPAKEPETDHVAPVAAELKRPAR